MNNTARLVRPRLSSVVVFLLVRHFYPLPRSQAGDSPGDLHKRA